MGPPGIAHQPHQADGKPNDTTRGRHPDRSTATACNSVQAPVSRKLHPPREKANTATASACNVLTKTGFMPGRPFLAARSHRDVSDVPSADIRPVAAGAGSRYISPAPAHAQQRTGGVSRAFTPGYLTPHRRQAKWRLPRRLHRAVSAAWHERTHRRRPPCDAPHEPVRLAVGTVVEISTEPERGLGVDVVTDERWDMGEHGQHFAKYRNWHMLSCRH
jgi:hypothetical protein